MDFASQIYFFHLCMFTGSSNQGGATGSARERRTTHTDTTGGGCGELYHTVLNCKSIVSRPLQVTMAAHPVQGVLNQHLLFSQS